MRGHYSQKRTMVTLVVHDVVQLSARPLRSLCLCGEFFVPQSLQRHRAHSAAQRETEFLCVGLLE